MRIILLIIGIVVEGIITRIVVPRWVLLVHFQLKSLRRTVHAKPTIAAQVRTVCEGILHWAIVRVRPLLLRLVYWLWLLLDPLLYFVPNTLEVIWLRAELLYLSRQLDYFSHHSRLLLVKISKVSLQYVRSVHHCRVFFYRRLGWSLLQVGKLQIYCLVSKLDLDVSPMPFDLLNFGLNLLCDIVLLLFKCEHNPLFMVDLLY